MATAMTMGCVLRECTNEEYHADGKESVSHSELECFIQSPALYYGRYITKEYARESTDALIFGSFLHERILENRTKFPIWSGGRRQGKEWEAFELANPVSLTVKDATLMELMAAQIKAHAVANGLLALPGSIRENGLWWDDPATAVRLRCRPDCYIPGRAIVDLKTTASADPQAFANSCEGYGYHRQAAWYQDGIFALTGETLPFLFLSIEKTPPYTCNVFRLDDDWVARGREENTAAIRRLMQCWDTGNWRGPQEILTLAPPKWAANTDQWRL